MAEAAALVQIAVITGPHGVRGLVKIRSLAENPENLFTYQPLTDASGQRRFNLTRHGGKDAIQIAAIEGIHSRNEAELLKNTRLFVPGSVLPEKPENQWYPNELTGLEARLTDGSRYGRVTGVYNFGAGDILDIERADGTSEMLPFIAGFVGDVVPKDGYLIVFPPK